MILWTKSKFYILYKKHIKRKNKELLIMVKTIEKHIDEIFNLLYGSKKNSKKTVRENTGQMCIRMHLAAGIMVSTNCLLPMTKQFSRTICLHMHRLLLT